MSCCRRSASWFVPAVLIGASSTAQAPQWLPTSTYPRVRSGACVAPMPFSGRPVIFSGGQGNAPFGIPTEFCAEADLWEWSGSRWSRSDAVGPPARWAAAMCLDVDRQRIVLFGGVNQSNFVLGDTWEFDGLAWTQRGPAVSPPVLWGHSLAYDPLRQRTVLFGASYLTWEWDGTNWASLVPPVQPVPRYGAAMAFDLGRGKVVLYGGVPAFGNAAPIGDTWTYDGNWVQLAAGTALTARSGAAMAYDAGRQQLLLFGGSINDAPVSETWRLAPAGAWTAVPTAHAPVAAPAPLLTYDLGSNRMLLACTESSNHVSSAATWFFDGFDWTRDAAPPQPPPREGHALVPDALPGGMLLFGGRKGIFSPFGVPGLQLADSWRWDGERWIDRTPAVTPSPRLEFQIATDRARSRVVLFGGLNSGAALGDTWEWDGQQWAVFTPGPQDPTPRCAGAMAYDAARGVCVQFGGVGSFNNLQTGTRTWDGTSWQLATTVEPPAATGVAMAYDAVRQEVLAFGGQVAPLVQNVLQNDVWRWNGSVWTHAAPAGAAPAPRTMAWMAFDPQRQRTIVHGGTVALGVATDTWEWDGAQWTQLASPVGEMARNIGSNSMVFDEHRGCMVLHDGAELWTWTALPGRALAYGSGCGVTAPLELSARGRPFLGNDAFHLQLLGAPPQQPFAVFLGFQPVSAPLGGGCTAWLVPAQVWVAGVTAGPAPLLNAPLPGDPALFGVAGGLQAAVLDAFAPLGFDVSNGLAIVLGF